MDAQQPIKLHATILARFSYKSWLKYFPKNAEGDVSFVFGPKMSTQVFSTTDEKSLDPT